MISNHYVQYKGCRRGHMIDETLINRIRKGEQAAFKKLYELYAEKIYRTAYMMINDKGLAQDIVQEVFIKIFTRIKDLKHNSAFSSWLYRITINCCLSYMHENTKVKLLFDDEELGTLPEENIEYIPEESTLGKELYDQVMKSIYELPKLQRVTIILYFYNDMTIKQIASIMECSEGTVKSRLFHGKRNLKELLECKNQQSKSEVSGYGFGKIN
jgi:RNA polymerase sigma-70 factor, ECF subfamily